MAPIQTSQIDDHFFKAKALSQLPEEGRLGILLEPKVRIEVPTFENEKLEMQKAGILQKPKEIYLEHCSEYSKKYMIKHNHEIDRYTFKKSDIQQGLLSQQLLNKFKELVGEDAETVADDQFSQYFQTLRIMIFTDFVVHNGMTYLIVKTWQKVILTDTK